MSAITTLSLSRCRDRRGSDVDMAVWNEDLESAVFVVKS